METYIENATFICGHRKSGTTLLLCLLDNHPELLVYPPDSAFFYGYYPTYDKPEYTDEQKVDRMTGFIVDQLKTEIVNLSDQDRKQLDFPIDALRESVRGFASKSGKTPREMLLSLFQAYRKHFKGSLQARRWVEKTTSTEIYAVEVAKWFPKAKFIHVIRDPRDNWASLKSGWSKRYHHFNDSLERLMQSMIDRGKLGMEFAQNNQKHFGTEVYKIVKFEDLATDTSNVLDEICSFLGIKFSETMSMPTVCGKLWKGNNFEGLKFDKPSNINVGRWRERITEDEARLIEYYFGSLMEYFEYETIYPLDERMEAATKHYKWFNFAQLYSQSTRSGEK